MGPTGLSVTPASVAPVIGWDHQRMLEVLTRSNAVDKRWAEGLIAGAATLQDLERAAIGTADTTAGAPLGSTHLRERGAAHGAGLARWPEHSG